MARPGLERAVVDAAVDRNTVARFREAGILLPTIGQLTHPSTIPAAMRARLAAVAGALRSRAFSVAGASLRRRRR
jgi:hypothetical protein